MEGFYWIVDEETYDKYACNDKSEKEYFRYGRDGLFGVHAKDFFNSILRDRKVRVKIHCEYIDNEEDKKENDRGDGIHFICRSNEEARRFWDSVSRAASRANKETIRKINESYQENIKIKKEVGDDMSLVGKKVKIRVDNYDADTLSPNFIKFLEDNKDRIFTVMQEPKYEGTDLYSLVEEPTWVFYETSLERVRFAGEM